MQMDHAAHAEEIGERQTMATVEWLQQEFDHAEAEATRADVALKTLKANPGTVIVFAKGLCCPSCAVGVRTKVKPLAFVDSSRLEDGVTLDAKHQLATIAVKKGKAVSPKALGAAVDSAGYDPVRLYTLRRGKLVRIELAKTQS